VEGGHAQNLTIFLDGEALRDRGEAGKQVVHAPFQSATVPRGPRPSRFCAVSEKTRSPASPASHDEDADRAVGPYAAGGDRGGLPPRYLREHWGTAASPDWEVRPT
jgi:hypothetical protein